CTTPPSFYFYLQCSHDHRTLHSFPTRRSSDLPVELLLRQIVHPFIGIFGPTDEQRPPLARSLILAIQVAVQLRAVALAIEHHDQLVQSLPTHSGLLPDSFGLLDQLRYLLQPILRRRADQEQPGGEALVHRQKIVAAFHRHLAHAVPAL